MSSRTTIVWLLIAVILGAAAFLLLRGGRGGGTEAVAVGQPVLSIDPTKLSAVVIEHPPQPGGDKERIDRGVAGAAPWVMRVTVAGAPALGGPGTEPAWPVAQGRMEALVRLLNDARARALPERDAAVGDAPTVVTIEQAGMSPVVLRLADRSIAGTALVEVENRNVAEGDAQRVVRAVVDDRLHQLFRGAGPREWRERAALSGIGLDASRVRLENDRGAVIALGRVQGSWSLREPFSAPADPASVQQLLQLLGGVQIADFLDMGPPAGASGLDKPIARVVVEIDRRDASGEGEATTTVEQRELAIGNAADGRGDRLFAKIDGTRTVVVDARAVAGLVLDPTRYVWPHPTNIPASEVGTIVLAKANAGPGDAGKVIRRELERWKEIRPTGDVMLADSEQAAVEALLTFLTGSGGAKPAPATSPAASAAAPQISATAPAGLSPVGQVSLLSLAGAPLDRMDVSRVDATSLVLKTGAVYRSYPQDRVPALLTELLRAAAPAGPDGRAGEREVTK